MNDDDQAAIETLPATPVAAADPLELLGSMLSMINSARQCERRVCEFRRETAAAVAAKAELAAGHAELAAARAALAQERAELASSRADVEKRRLAVHAAEGMLTMRERYIADLEAQWKYVSETDPLVLSGMRAPEYGTALQKARRAAGIDPPLEDDDDEPAVGRRLSRETEDGTPLRVDTTITADIPVRARPARSQRRAEQ
jgi:hypothetical protein